jgi:hypothetical protein
MTFANYLEHKERITILTRSLKDYSNRLVDVLPKDSVDNFAGALRDTLPALITEFGAAAGAIGITYYSDIRAASRVAGSFVPQMAPIEASNNTNTAVSFLAKTFVDSNGNNGLLRTNLGDELQRSVIGVERRTMVDNSVRDSGVTLYQRVASADACEFCSMVAFDPNLTKEFPKSYHRNCFCTVEPVFRGAKAITPDYYQGFGEQYREATSRLGPNDRSTQNILAEVRLIRGAEDAAADARRLAAA